jgi:very-short-patch-repair endonuclease
MTELYNRAEFTSLRRKLRHTIPPAEQRLWPHLRNRQLETCKFRRQYGIDRYVIDFYAPELKLALEIDGPTHHSPEAQTYDRDRQTYLESTGATVLRFTNWQVYNQLDQVLDAIAHQIRTMRQPQPPQPKTGTSP